MLIVHADDIGVAHSVNAATIEAFGKGIVNSGSIMVPCPWFPEIAAYARDHPDLDLGLHLTLTSEWKHYRWGSVLPADDVPTLLDEQGFFYASSGEAAQNMDPREAEAEMRAQVERALAFGIEPTHLDTHMGTVLQTPELFEAYLRVGRAYAIPVLIPRVAIGVPPSTLAVIKDHATPDNLFIDHVATASPDVPSDQWRSYYQSLIEDLEPGVTEILIHLGYDEAELQAVTIDHPDFGAAWRQRDFDVFTDPAFLALLEKHNVELITWRKIGTLLQE